MTTEIMPGLAELIERQRAKAPALRRLLASYADAADDTPATAPGDGSQRAEPAAAGGRDAVAR